MLGNKNAFLLSLGLLFKILNISVKQIYICTYTIFIQKM